MVITRFCPICGKEYLANPVRLKRGKETTCSRDCSYILRGRLKSKQIELECEVCHVKFTRSESSVQTKHGYSFCSPECQYKGRSLGLTKRIVETPYTVTEEGIKGWLIGAAKTKEIRIAKDNYKHTPDSKAKLSIATSNYLAKTKSTYSVSKLEITVQTELINRNIDFTSQYPIRNANGTFACVFDFLLSNGVALEVNGTFWHTDPRVYPNGATHEMQKRGLVKYALKLEEAKKQGIRIVELWEYDLRNDFKKAIDIALKDAFSY